MKLKLDLHDIYNRGGDIDRALRAIIDEAVIKRAPLVEIIPGMGSGALRSVCCAFWINPTSRPDTTVWRRTRPTSAGSSYISAGSEPLRPLDDDGMAARGLLAVGPAHPRQDHAAEVRRDRACGAAMAGVSRPRRHSHTAHPRVNDCRASASGPAEAPEITATECRATPQSVLP